MSLNCIFWRCHKLRHFQSQIATSVTNCDTFSHKLRHCHKMRRSQIATSQPVMRVHDDVIKWRHFPRYWPFMQGIHQSPVNSSHKGQWRGALMFSLICAWLNAWVNQRDAGDLRCHRAHYDVILMLWKMNKEVMAILIWIVKTMNVKSYRQHESWCRVLQHLCHHAKFGSADYQ